VRVSCSRSHQSIPALNGLLIVPFGGLRRRSAFCASYYVYNDLQAKTYWIPCILPKVFSHAYHWDVSTVGKSAVIIGLIVLTAHKRLNVTPRKIAISTGPEFAVFGNASVIDFIGDLRNHD